MIIDLDYLENNLVIENEKVLNIEIENKKYFYRIVNDLYSISNGEALDYIKVFNEEKEENITGKITIFNDYFQFDFKRYIAEINKYVINNIEEDDKKELMKPYKELLKKYKICISKFDLPINISEDLSLEKLIKAIKVDINLTTELLNNLLAIIDIEKELLINKILVFVNLKQYLSNEELNELYKYSLYSNVKIILIDSQSYGGNREYEKKLIIDENLVEFMI